MYFLWFIYHGTFFHNVGIVRGIALIWQDGAVNTVLCESLVNIFISHLFVLFERADQRGGMAVGMASRSRCRGQLLLFSIGLLQLPSASPSPSPSSASTNLEEKKGFMIKNSNIRYPILTLVSMLFTRYFTWVGAYQREGSFMLIVVAIRLIFIKLSNNISENTILWLLVFIIYQQSNGQYKAP